MRSDLHDLWDNYEFGVNPDVSTFMFHRLVFAASILFPIF